MVEKETRRNLSMEFVQTIAEAHFIKIKLIFCLAHARRKFKDAYQYEEELATFALTKFQALYETERYCKEQHLDYDQIKHIRQDKSVQLWYDATKPYRL